MQKNGIIDHTPTHSVIQIRSDETFGYQCGTSSITWLDLQTVTYTQLKSISQISVARNTGYNDENK